MPFLYTDDQKKPPPPRYKKPITERHGVNIGMSTPPWIISISEFAMVGYSETGILRQPETCLKELLGGLNVSRISHHWLQDHSRNFSWELLKQFPHRVQVVVSGCQCPSCMSSSSQQMSKQRSQAAAVLPLSESTAFLMEDTKARPKMY